MKIFISWSGELSRQIGSCFNSWIPRVLQQVDTFFSPEDIEIGEEWRSKIETELEESQFGIFCLTPDNLKSEWILFEAGAISKQFTKSHVCPILFDLSLLNLPRPLSAFQACEFDRDSIFKLISNINNNNNDKCLDDFLLQETFNMWWPKLNDNIESILKQNISTKEAPKIKDREILEEILFSVRDIKKILGQNESLSRYTLDLSKLLCNFTIQLSKNSIIDEDSALLLKMLHKYIIDTIIENKLTIVGDEKIAKINSFIDKIPKKKCITTPITASTDLIDYFR